MTETYENSPRAAALPLGGGGPRTVAADLIARVSQALGPRLTAGDTTVLLVEFTDDGLIVGGLELHTGTTTGGRLDRDLRPAEIDRRVADHVVAVGRVEQPTSEQWRDELLDLVARARERLRTADGTFIMGRQYIRLFRLARRDVEESTRDLIAHADALTSVAVTETAAAAVVIDDDAATWPGLRDSIARAVSVPVVELSGPELSAEAAPPASGDGLGAREVSSHDFPAIGVPVGAPDAQSPERPTRPAAPDGQWVADDDTPTQPIPVSGPTALAYSAQPDELPLPDEPLGDEPLGVEPLAETEGLPYDAPAPEHAPISPSPESGRARRPRRQVLAVLTAACVAAVAVVVTLLAVGDDAQTDTAALSGPAPTSASPEPTFADPAVLAEASQPAVRYTPPPPPPPPRTTAEAPRQAPRPQPRPAPRIVIPLPGGLPPIVIP